MSSKGWKLLPLEDCMEAIIDYRGKTPRKSSFGIPLITAKIVKGGRILEPTEFIPYEDYDERMQRGIPKAGDVVITTEAPLGEVGQLDNRKLSVGQRLITLRGKNDLLDNTYLKFLMMSEFVQNQLLARATGTTVTGIKQTELRKIDLLIPPLSTQHRIADLLSALDDKIELNLQTNTTLEAIGQAIFKEWFVDFNFPGTTGEMEESALGMIPQGWWVGKLGQIIEFAYGKGLKSENRVEGEYPVIGSNGIVGVHNKYLVEGPGIVIGRKGTIGEVTWVHSNFYPIDTTFYINDLLGTKDLYFYYFLLKGQDFKKIASDSAVPGLNRNQAYDNLVVIPPKEIMKLFNDNLLALFQNIYNNEQQSTTLSIIRDAFLPKLMSGEIEV